MTKKAPQKQKPKDWTKDRIYVPLKTQKDTVQRQLPVLKEIDASCRE